MHNFNRAMWLLKFSEIDDTYNNEFNKCLIKNVKKIVKTNKQTKSLYIFTS